MRKSSPQQQEHKAFQAEEMAEAKARKYEIK